MFIYLFVLFLMLFISIFEKIVLNRRAIIIPVLLLVVLATVRDYTVGTDTVVYVSKFINNLDSNYYEFDKNIEYGYQVLEYVILSLNLNYFYLFFITSLFVVSLFLKTIKNLSVNYVLSIFLYYTLGFYTFFFNGLRQGIAVAICFFALPYFIEKQLKKFIIAIFIASLFHISALIFLLYYFVINYFSFKLEYKLFFLFFISLVFSKFVIFYLADSNERYSSYSLESDYSGGYLILIFYILLGLVFYFFGVARISCYRYLKIREIYLCGIALIIPVALIGTDPSGPQRLIVYSACMSILLLPYIFTGFKNSVVKLLFLIFCIVYFCLITARFGNLYPYKINPLFEIF